MRFEKISVRMKTIHVATNGFLALSFVVTALAAAGKAILLLRPVSPFEGAHPLLTALHVRDVAALALIAEIAVLIAIPLLHRQQLALTSVCSLYTVFGVYRLMLAVSGVSYGCHCFGDLHSVLGVPEQRAEQVSLILLVAILVCGYMLTCLHIISSRFLKAELPAG